MNRSLFAIIIIFAFYFHSNAQDIHLSQHKESPLLLNPANTANNEGDWRAGLNYREQWTNTNLPYNTFDIYYDRKVYQHSRIFMVGGYILYDQLQSNGISKLTISPSLAYRLDYLKNSFKIGIQPGIGFYSINNSLTHPDQFNYETGTFDNNLHTSDIPKDFSKMFFDAAFGVNYTRPIYNYSPRLGLAFYHINRPNTAIYSDNQKYRIPVKSVLNFDVPIAIKSDIIIYPSLLLVRQRKSQEITMGADASFATSGISNIINQIFTGIYYRNAKKQGISSMVLIGGFEYNNIRMAISYDQYFIPENLNSALGSTFEISLSYRGINTFTDKFSIPCEVY